jgi:hypothetical protein
MFSPVSYLPPSPPPRPSPSVRDMAAAGYFRALALWLNEPLTPQGIFVKVQAARPGCLKLTVEFERPPIKDRLLRFLCHRVWVLNSELIEGIHVIARPIGSQRMIWQKRIRIVTPAVKQRRSSQRVPQRPQGPYPMVRGMGQKVVQLSGHQLKTLRNLMITGSAVAAFMLGCLLEALMAGTTPLLPGLPVQLPPSQALEPSNDEGKTFPAQGSNLSREVTAIDYRSPENADGSGAEDAEAVPHDQLKRPTVVDAALEPVGVIQHHLPDGVASEDVTLLFGGDVALDNLAYDELADSGGLFAEVEDYLQADLSMVTLGSPLATAATTLEEELHERNRPDAVNLLAESGIDIVNLTNDSLMEHGTQGLDETLTALDSKGIYRVGAGRNETEARRPEVIDVKGKRIAYLSYSMGGDRSAFEDRAGTNAQDIKEIMEDIQALRPGVDWIVVNYRWMEFVTETPNDTQTNLARMAIEQGADVVVGYHPDVIQGAEVYKGRPIAYSVGDFVFETENSLEDQDSAMLKVSLKQDQMKVEFVPVRVQDSIPKPLKGPEGEAVLEAIQQASQQFEKPMQSPIVLDLKEKAPAVPEVHDPESPFVTPEAEDTLSIPAETPTAPEPETRPAGSDAPASADSAPADPPTPIAPDATSETSTPSEPVDLMEQLDLDKLDWGPKPSDGQQEFRPIPQKHRDSPSEDRESGPLPGLRLFPESSQSVQPEPVATAPTEPTRSNQAEMVAPDSEVDAESIATPPVLAEAQAGKVLTGIDAVPAGAVAELPAEARGLQLKPLTSPTDLFKKSGSDQPADHGRGSKLLVSQGAPQADSQD